MKKAIILLISVLFTALMEINVVADGVSSGVTEYDYAESAMPSISSSAYCVSESTTGKILYEHNSNKVLPCSHLTKLALLLLCGKKSVSGSFSMNKTVTVSSVAASCTGSGIWLKKGDKVKVSDLVKAISIGNANDAATALGEYMYGSVGECVSQLNLLCKKLKMTKTKFYNCADCNDGQKNVSTAADLAKLSAELLKYPDFTKYTATWSDMVRENKYELVNLNRLVRSCRGIEGLKACFSEKVGACLCAAAKRGKMEICVTVLGGKSLDETLPSARKMIDYAEKNFQLYTPVLPEKITRKAVVKNGEKLSVKLVANGPLPVIIKRGTGGDITCEWECKEKLTAPLKKGEAVGSVTYKMGDKLLEKFDICTSNKVNKMNFKCAFSKLMYNLLNLEL